MADINAGMPASTTPRFLQLHQMNVDAVRQELLAGLEAKHAFASPKFLYDALGSRLFDAITELPEYYPTRTEAAIFAAHSADMATRIPAGATLVDLGAGNCAKAARLFPALRPSRYVAVDISADHLRGALAHLQPQFPALEMFGVGTDFSALLALPPDVLAPTAGGNPAPVVLFYPGSSIGNFSPADALRFLRQTHAACLDGAVGERAGGGLLIGVDRVKPASVLEPAYDDALGVTAAFNRNLLRHFNRLAGTDFAVGDWEHVALWNTAESRIEMHLEARRAVTVRWPVGERRFNAGERIHTENSYKWQEEDFAALLREAGFSATQAWSDEQGWFSVFWAQV